MLESEMKKKEFILLLFLIFTLFVLGISIFLEKISSGKGFNYIQSATTFSTALILIWYTVETWRLRKESQKQTEIYQRPLVIVEYKNTYILSIRNISNNVAINFSIDDIHTDNISIKIPGIIPIILPGESKEIQTDRYKDGKKIDPVLKLTGYPNDITDPLEADIGLIAGKGIDITARFYNADMTPYYVKERIGLTSHDLRWGLEIIQTGQGEP